MKTVEEVLEHFQVKEEDGLSVDDVEKLREKYGPNGKRIGYPHADYFRGFLHLSLSHHLPLSSLSPPLHTLSLQSLLLFVCCNFAS